ncbi:MAG: hypothetical protein HY241_09605 [Actinobacteria bacterium]|nr:hypothetical protein [Actinomycetota bacterium]
MRQDEILATIQELIAAIKRDTVPVRPHDVRLDSSFAAPPLSMDSLDFVRFLVEVEEAFDIVADDADFLRVETVGDSVRLVRELLTEAAGHDGSAQGRLPA